jgi:hypothetical protein
MDLPTINEPSLVAWFEYAGDRTFVHQDGKARYHDSAFTAWTRHRVVSPALHWVYLLRLASGAPYVGITRLDRFPARMKQHQRHAQREAPPESPSGSFLRRHGWGHVEEIALVPDRIAARLTEASWTCAMTARGEEVFGNWPGDLCPAKAWIEAPSWGRNWLHPRVPDVAFFVSADDTVRTVYTSWLPGAAGA